MPMLYHRRKLNASKYLLTNELGLLEQLKKKTGANDPGLFKA
jgi:hypothetical protein